MNFSELFKHTGQLCQFSPDGKFLASVVQYRLVIRDVETLQVLNLFSCVDTIQYIEWASDSEFILCGMFKRGLVQVWSLENPEWTCKIDEGSAGLCAVKWSPDGRHILTTADFHLRVTVWSLTDKSVSYIKYAKQCQKGMDFNADGRYMALAERRHRKDCISIFDCKTWRLFNHFQTETEDLAGIQWSPDDSVLLAWDSLLHYKVLIYAVDGHCLATYSAYGEALGVKSVAWSSTSQLLAIGSYDQKVRILNHITWNIVTEEDHPSTIQESNVIVYQETESRATQMNGEEVSHSSLFSSQSKYEIQALPATVPVVDPDPSKANPVMGIGQLAFSSNCQYMYSKNDNMPRTLWVWDIRTLRLAVVLIQASPILCIEWDPHQPRLALCTGTNKLYMWSPGGSLAVEIPAEASFKIEALRWHSDGNALVLIGQNEMCVCFLSNNATETATEDS